MTVAKQIDPSPPAPSRQNPADFDAKGDAMLAFLETKLVPQVNAVSLQLNEQADAAVASAASAANNATVTSQARADAVAAAEAAAASANGASGSAATATTKAAEALASANAAAAIQGIPSVAGNGLKSLRVNAAGDGIEWVVDGNALGFNPVQQGTGINQVPDKIVMLGKPTGANPGLKATVDGVDLGFVVTVPSTTNATVNFGRPVTATSFTGKHVGDGSSLTGLTAAQVASALAYTPANAAMFAPAGTAEVGRYVDMHAVDATNSFDVRLEAIRAAGAAGDAVAPDGSGDLKITAARLVSTGPVNAPSFVGSAAGLTGFSAAQVNTALGYVPASTAANAGAFNGLAQIFSAYTDFSSIEQATLRVVQNNPASASAHMEFLRAGVYGIKLGLDASNTFCLGGWSQGAFNMRFYSDPVGNLTALGNVTAFSDIRFKTDIEPLRDPVRKLLSIEHGGFKYLDTNTGQHKYGVAAQAVAKMFPHAVVTNDQGYMSVAYGQLALAALIEVTREFDATLRAQQKQIAHLLVLLKMKGE